MKPNLSCVVLTLLVMAAVAMPAYGGTTLLAHFPFNEGGTSAFAVNTGGGINTYVMTWEAPVPRPDTNPPGWNPWVDEGGGFSYITFVDSGNNILTLAGDPNWYGTFGGSNPLPDADRLNLRMEPAGAVEMWYRSDDFKSSLFSHEGNGGGAGPGGGNIAGLAIGSGYSSQAGNIAGTLSGNQNGGSSNGQVGGTTHFATGIGDVPAPLGDWTHVVLTWVENSHARLYVNGAQAGSDVPLDFTPNLGLFRSHMGLDGTAGTGSNSGSFYPNADVDEVKLWQGEMLASQALANFQAGRPVPEPAVLGLLSISALLIWRRRRA